MDTFSRKQRHAFFEISMQTFRIKAGFFLPVGDTDCPGLPLSACEPCIASGCHQFQGEACPCRSTAVFPSKYNDMSNNFMIFETLHIHFSECLREREMGRGQPHFVQTTLSSRLPFPWWFYQPCGVHHSPPVTRFCHCDLCRIL